MDQRTRKLMTMHPRDDVDRLYVPRKKGGRRLASTEDSIDYSTTWWPNRKAPRRTIYKSTEKDWLQLPETILTTRRPTEQ